MKLAEGYGIVVLERAADAARRGAKALATVLGWGESATPIISPSPTRRRRRGPRIEQASPAPASSSRDRSRRRPRHRNPRQRTPANMPPSRASSASACARPVVAFKSHLGHTLGGAGAVELIPLHDGDARRHYPACASVTREDLEFPDSTRHGEPRKAEIRATSNTRSVSAAQIPA